MDLSSGHCTIKFGQVKENNIQVWFGTWDGDLGLPSHIKNEFANSLPCLFTLIILLVIMFIWINLHLKKISETLKSPLIVTFKVVKNAFLTQYEKYKINSDRKNGS